MQVSLVAVALRGSNPQRCVWRDYQGKEKHYAYDIVLPLGVLLAKHSPQASVPHQVELFTLLSLPCSFRLALGK